MAQDKLTALEKADREIGYLQAQKEAISIVETLRNCATQPKDRWHFNNIIDMLLEMTFEKKQAVLEDTPALHHHKHWM